MKKSSILIFCFCLFAINTYSQNATIPNSYIIKSLTDISKKSFYENAINISNMEIYRLKNERTEIEFSNGFILELFSAEELVKNHSILDSSNYIEKSNINITKPEFKILNNGFLVVRFKTKESKF